MLTERRTLRPHQVTSRDKVIAQLGTNDRALLVSACGTGKTLTLHGIIEKSGARRVAAFFPSLALVDQTILEWGKQCAGRMRVIVVCSDESVGARFASAKRADEIAVSDEELEASGATVIRDVDELSTLLQEYDPSDVPLYVFSTYQSSQKVAEAQQNTGVWFDIAIADEAHKLAVRDTKRATDRTGKLLLDSDAILARKRVFATATPKTFTFSASAETHRGAEASMDNEEVFGAVADTVGLRDAIRLGLLTDYRIHILGVAPTQIAQDAAAHIDPEDADVRMRLGVAALQRAQSELGVTRVIAYLSSRARANEFARLVNGANIADCSVITGDQPTSQRTPKLDALAEDGGVIANVRCLTEGVDVPALDAVLFVDPRTSKIDIVQAVGRAIRLAPSKDLGHVILPVLNDPADADGEFDDQAYKAVWDVLAQMAENDTALSAYLTAIAERGDVTPRENEDDGGQIINVMAAPGFFTERFAERFILRAAQMNDPLGATWRVHADALAEFVRVEGRWPIMFGAQDEERTLGSWLGTQRTNARKGKLSPERMAYLDQVTPGWLVDAESEWRQKADALAEFVRAEGRWPSTTSAENEEKTLGEWLVRHRTNARKGKLSPERMAYLDQAAPDWLVDAEAKWRQRADALAEFVRSEGHLPSRESAQGEEKALGQWLSHQRMDARKGKLSLERADYLDQVVPGWLVDAETEWREKADALAEFVRVKRHWPSTKSTEGEERALGVWLNNQRTNTRKGKLSTERTAYLDQVVPGWLADAEAEWREKADALAEFVRVEGRWPRGRSTEGEEKALGNWLVGQRMGARKGKLSPERTAYLDQVVPAWLVDAEAEWREKADALAEFVRVEGRWPSTKSTEGEEGALGVWLSNQRTNTRKGKLSTERTAYLDQVVPGWLADAEAEWREKADALAEFVRVEGRWPRGRSTEGEQKALGKWLVRQRMNARKDKLSPERTAYLDQVVPGWEDSRSKSWAMSADSIKPEQDSAASLDLAA